MDRILAIFLSRQIEEARRLAQASDILTFEPVPSADPPQAFLASFKCSTFVQNESGRVERTPAQAVVGIYFPDDYLRQANNYQVVTWLTPKNVFHPNILPQVGAICVGERFLRPGTPLVELLYQLYSIIAYQKWSSNSALNPAAAEFARNHQSLLPADPRPLKRRTLNLDIRVKAADGSKP